MFESMLDGVLVAGVDHRIVMANEAAARIFELPVPALLVPLAEFPVRFGLREPSGEPALPISLRALKGEIVAPVERLIRTSAGAEKTIRTSAAPLRDDHGTVVGAVSLVADVTAMKAAEDRAREDAARLQRALDDRAVALARAEHAAELLEYGDAFVEVDSEWRILSMNRSLEAMSGRPRSETVGRVLWDVWPEAADPRGRYWTEYRRCMEGRAPVEFQAHFPPLDLWTAVTAYPTRAGGMAAFMRDITPQKRAEERLRESEARARAVSDNMRDALVVLECVRDDAGAARDWRYLEANDGALKLLGKETRDAVVGRSVREVLPERAAAALERPARVLETGEPERYEAEYEGKALLITVFRIAANTVGLASLDITDRKRREVNQALLAAIADDLARLASEEEITRAIGARLAAHLGITLCTVADFADGVATVRSAFTGPGAVELPSTLKVSDYLDEDSQREARAGRPVVIRDTRADPRADALRRFEALGVRAGVVVPFLVGGRWRHSFAVGTAVPRDWREDEIQLLQEVAARFFPRIERARADEALARANAQLVEADRRKTEFLGVLSHELRNPLAPVRNSVYLLEKVDAASPQAARARDVIRRQTEHLTRLVDDLLDVTRISRGKIRLQREVQDLRGLVRGTCEDHRALFEDAEIELSLDLPAAPVWVEVDATRIAQVVGNLLHNASKFTPAYGTVTVRLRRHEGHAEVDVLDTGIGMDRPVVERLFEPFMQEDRSLARTRGGLGLGLALSKGLVDLHGGTIRAWSGGAGKGAAFTISLPLAQPPPRATPTGAARDTGRARRRILVVEDDLDAARTLAAVLELDGHEVAVARSGAEAVALARELKPDVVICDLGLPDVDGYEVARTLREDESLRSTRLIALSGYAHPEDVERALEAGFEAHLPKPAPLEALAGLLG